MGPTIAPNTPGYRSVRFQRFGPSLRIIRYPATSISSMSHTIQQLYQSLLPSIEHFHLLGYWVAFFVALFETMLVVGLLIPGSTLLLLLGALAAGGQLDFNGVLWFGIAGAVLGDNLNYWLGQRYGRRWIRNGIWLLKPAHFDQARRFFDAHGAKSVFLGRFIPSIKEVAPFVAGTVGMRQRVFMLWNLLGGIGWGLLWIGTGYLFGQSLKLAQAWMSRAGMGLLVFVLAWLILWLMKRTLLRHGPHTWMLITSMGRSVMRAVLDNVFVRRFLLRHPRLVYQLAARTDRTHFYGLPLTLLAIAFVYVLALTGGIIEDLVTSDTIVALDHATAQLVATFRPPELVAPFIWVTALGTSTVVAILLSAMALILWLARGVWFILPLLASSLGAVAFSTLGKLTFERPRPPEALLLEHSYSFPSGHATIAVAFYGFVGYLLIRSSNSWKRKVNWLAISTTLILLIGLSRIFLGVHYLSDVWAGYLIGALWLIIGITLSEWLTATGYLQWDGRVDPRRLWGTRALGVIALAGYLAFCLNWHPPRNASPAIQEVRLDRPVNEVLLEQKVAYTETLFGDPEQPVGIVILAQDADKLLSTLREAGWQPADKVNTRNLLRLATSARDYAAAPIAPTFWAGHINNFALHQTMRSGDGKINDTLRIWTSPYRTAHGQIFIGVARAYDGIRWPLIHHISPDLERASDAVVQSLHGSDQKMLSCKVSLVEPLIGRFMFGEEFFSRGEVWLLNLTGRPEPTLPCGV